MFAAVPEDDVAEQPRWQQVLAEPQLQQYGWKKLMCTTTKNKKTKLVKYQSPTGVYYKNLADAQAAIARAAFEASGSDLELIENIDAITERYLSEEIVTTTTPVQNARRQNPVSLTPVSFDRQSPETLTPVSLDRRHFTPTSAVLRRTPASSTPTSASLKRRNSRTAGHQDEYVSPSKRLSMSTPQRPAAPVESSLLNTPPGPDISFSLNERVAASDESYEGKMNGFQIGQKEMFKSSRLTPEHKVKIAVFSCEQCESKFKTREFLNKHKLEVHLKNTSPISLFKEPTVFSMANVASSMPAIPPGPPIQGSTMQPYELKVPNLAPRQMGKATLQLNEIRRPTEVIPRLKPKKKGSSRLNKTLPKINVRSNEIEEEDEVEEMEQVSSSSRVNVTTHVVDSDQTQDYFDAMMDTLGDEDYDDDEEYLVQSKRNQFDQNTLPGRNLPSFKTSNPQAQGRKIPAYFTYPTEEEENEEYFSASDDDSKSFPSDSEEEEEREERVVKDEPEEITLDESDDEINVIEDVHLAQAAKERMKNEFATLVENEDQLAHDDFVEYILGEDEVAVDQYQRETWYCQPASWKPKGTESWNATCSQIANFYKLRDFSIAGLTAVSTWDEFHEMVVPRADEVNPGRSVVHLYKLMKAKWFESLEPVIPAHMKVVVETLDDEDM